MKITLPWVLPFIATSFLSAVIFACADHSGSPQNFSEKNAPISEIQNIDPSTELSVEMAPIHPGIYSMPDVLDLIGDRTVGVTSNHTGIINGVHLVDTLLASGVMVKSVFSPEHGFRGDRPDGEVIESGVDPRTGLAIISLYGSNKKPKPEQLEGLEVMIFDIQDVGARFYTYLSTLHYVMEACAEQGIPIVVLDRPNPNIDCIDGPVLDPKFSSFVGMHPVPVVYGMTIGEYARMINGEGWLEGGVKVDLHVVHCTGYTRSMDYALPVAPSPNLPDMTAIYLYPSLCFFEATIVSVGRGTGKPFSVIGEPTNRNGEYTFTPQSIPNASLHPKHEGQVCRGYDLNIEVRKPEKLDRVDLSWLFRMYRETGDPNKFFDRPGFFDKLAGTDALRKSILEGESEEQIRTSWRGDLEKFMKVREKYLIYP